MPRSVQYVVHVSSGDDSFRHFGWTALVAIGTLLLAVATAIVAFRTWRLATETSKLAAETSKLAAETADDVAGQHRPVVTTGVSAGQLVAARYVQRGLLAIRLRNSGLGPALDVQALLQPDGRAAEPWNRGVVPPAEEVLIQFDEVTTPPPAGGFDLHVQYRDVSQRTYESVIFVEADPRWVPPPGTPPRLLVRDVVVERI
jgi:alpha-beta hydrolase superfamily lysophospholipase